MQTTIGIIGGMGPEAANRLAELITSLTDAESDQSHIPVITYNNSLIPSRVEAISANGPSPLPEMIRTARVLQAAGASFLLMPCNTAHYYFDNLQAAVEIPILHLIEEAASHITLHHSQAKKIGLLATSATLASGLYHQALQKHGKTVIAPSELEQEEVMEAIFGQAGIKAGQRSAPKEQLLKVAQHLIARGAEVIIMGCTEVSLVLNNGDVDVALVDPLQVVAALAIRRARLAEVEALQITILEQVP